MMIRRVLATAVALAVTTPAALLSVSHAYADAKSTAQTQGRQNNPAIGKLKAAAAEAQKAYDKAAQAKADGVVELAKTLGELDGAHPLAVASAAAKRAAKDAANTKINADQAVTDAKTALGSLPENATEEERGAAATTLSKAEATAATAATVKATADVTAAEAQKKVDDARGAAISTHGVLDKAVDAARAVKAAADAALAKATKEAQEKGEDCEAAPGLTAEVTGLPDKLVAGTTTTFSVRVTNGSDRHMDEIITYTGVHATDRTGLKDTGKFFRLQWSTTSSTQWQNLNKDSYIDGMGALKPGAHADVKLRLTLDKAAPTGNGVLFMAADFYNKDGVCGGTPGADMHQFDINAAGNKPGTTQDATPSPTAKPATGNTHATPQSSTPGAPATTGTNDNLAATGSSSPTTSIALAGGAAVLLGAAAVFVVRRRKTSSDA
ncbi:MULTISPECIES: LAETG motif-containing sortase-dependent surface protein [unclassified Streptomyces]|uniref:LAETG motif-containing sortase-dependent surface protein n=1 Tax=unclassified Streptomyces TaxID=2593676 RepID=UPI000978F427|nr:MULTISPECIES: LAETG motif-containing sortase-dependent surface protein [unclassified Streptomyces]RDV46976.1 LPXTG cell wall anchor domain-containing protein [Streptomyces sp. IB2014 011-12]